jgi:hypothetical protein
VTQSDFKITPWFNANLGKDGVRATYFGKDGTSTKTCNTVSEARGFIAQCRNRKPPPTDLSYRLTDDYINQTGKWAPK